MTDNQVFPTTSPVPVQKPVELDFPDAIRELIHGKRITRLGWDDQGTYGILSDSFLMICINGELKRWLVNDGDLTATDWIVLE